MQFIKLFFKLLLALLIIRACYSIFHVLFREFVKFFEFIITGSEHYWKRSWLLRHRGTDKIEYKNIDIYNQARGWTLMPNLNNRAFNRSIVNSDSAGARGKPRAFDDRDIVLFFGDSFCFGEDVNDDKTIPHFFEEKFKSVQAINLGVHGYGIDQQFIYFKEVAGKYQPKLVCFVIYYDDFMRNFLGFRDYAKPKLALERGKEKLIQYPVLPPEYYLKASSVKLFFFMVLDFFRQCLVFYGLLERKKRQKLCAWLLDQINQTAKEFQTNLVFVYIPNSLSWPYRNYIDKFFIDYFNESKLPFLNLGCIFKKEELSMFIDSSSGHFSVKANELVAEKLADFIKKNPEAKS